MSFSPARLAGPFLGLALVLAASGASAQTASAGHVTPVAADTRSTRAQLDTATAELDQYRAALARPTLAAEDLQNLKARIDPVAVRLRALGDEVAPRLDAAKARLDQLGAAPKTTAESADAARDRAELDETTRLTRALVLEAEQLSAEIGDRRRSLFTRALFERNAGIAGAGLWASAVQSLPGDAAALRTVLADLGSRFMRDGSLPSLTLLGLALGLGFALHVGRRRLAPRLIHRATTSREPTRRRKLRSALVVLLVETLPAVIGSVLVYAVIDGSGLAPVRVMPAVISVLAGIAYVAFVRALAEALLAPDAEAWRLAKLGDAAAARTYGFAVAIAALIAAGKVVEALYQVIAAGLPLTVLTRSGFALAVAALLGELLRRFATTESAEEACLGPYIPTQPEVGGPVRILGWIVVAVVAAAALWGYVAFASFLVDQFAWISILLVMVLFSIALTDEFVGGSLTEETRLSTTLQANTGLRRQALQQIGVLLDGILRVVLIVVALMLALAPWGVESTDLLSSVRAAFFGFRVGDVSISIATIAFAVFLFGLGFIATRVVQGWLEATFLPTTDLDAGLRNSIATAFGYLGFFVAASLAFSYLGLGLDKIAIVAGALSVGIGFGLQSIVNNFVSGLILLWERPIRVGDLVVVGDNEGHVRRIKVRATEIETFDRSTIIVPNSNLISGVVRNRVRGDRSGRIVLPVNVLRNQDPARAGQVLLAAAQGPRAIHAPPAPRGVFKKIGAPFLEFELVCFVDDVNNQVRAHSELNFAVFERLVAEGIIPPLGPGATTILGLETVQGALDHIAEALERAPAAAASSPAGVAPDEPRPGMKAAILRS